MESGSWYRSTAIEASSRHGVSRGYEASEGWWRADSLTVRPPRRSPVNTLSDSASGTVTPAIPPRAGTAEGTVCSRISWPDRVYYRIIAETTIIGTRLRTMATIQDESTCKLILILVSRLISTDSHLLSCRFRVNSSMFTSQHWPTPPSGEAPLVFCRSCYARSRRRSVRATPCEATALRTLVSDVRQQNTRRRARQDRRDPLGRVYQVPAYSSRWIEGNLAVDAQTR